MNAAFAMQDDTPARIDREDVNLGIAIDVERKDGSRSLLVPNVKRSQTMDFAQFLKAYNEVVRKARNNTLEISDFEGTTISLTNPGTIGTIASVPRLMQSQGTIIATGQIDYPAEYSAADPSVLADLGISKVMTMTSTYDHRIIQGAESGAFLARVHELLLGADGFYEDHLPRPAHPVRAGASGARTAIASIASEDEKVAREAAVLQMINAYRVRGHLLADLDPLEYEVERHPELDPRVLRPHHLGPRPRIRLRRPVRQAHREAARHPRHAARDVLRQDRPGVHAHPGNGAEEVAAGSDGAVAQSRSRSISPRSAAS